MGFLAKGKPHGLSLTCELQLVDLPVRVSECALPNEFINSRYCDPWVIAGKAKHPHFYTSVGARLGDTDMALAWHDAPYFKSEARQLVPYFKNSSTQLGGHSRGEDVDWTTYGLKNICMMLGCFGLHPAPWYPPPFRLVEK